MLTGRTVIVLIYVGWVLQFTEASCPHKLGSIVGGRLVAPDLNAVVHGPAARPLILNALGRKMEKNE